MKNTFNYIALSIFFNCNIQDVRTTVEKIYDYEIKNNTATITQTHFVVDDYFNPQSGGSHLPKFCCWSCDKYPNIVFFVSNYEDGLSNLCRLIQKHIHGELLMCSLCNDQRFPFNKFYYSDTSFSERIVLSYKEDKWVFYEKGNPIDIEDIANYKNKLIKNRLNIMIIDSYIRNLGINIWSIDENVNEFFQFERLCW